MTSDGDGSKKKGDLIGSIVVGKATISATESLADSVSSIASGDVDRMANVATEFTVAVCRENLDRWAGNSVF